MLWVPVASVEVVYFAAPALTGTVFSVVVPSLKVTVPVELPLNGGLIVAVKVTAVPCGAGFGEDWTVVVVFALFTTSFTALEVLRWKSVLPG